MDSEHSIIDYRRRWLESRYNVVDSFTGELREKTDYEEFESNHQYSDWMKTI